MTLIAEHVHVDDVGQRGQQPGNQTDSNKVLYVQEVVTLQKEIFNIRASENEVYTNSKLLRYFSLNIIRYRVGSLLPGHTVVCNNAYTYFLWEFYGTYI